MKAQKVWFENGRIYLLTGDGREGSLPIRIFPRLYNATPEQRDNYTLSHFGIHWPDIDEDLSYEGFFSQENSCAEENELKTLFTTFPELNVRQVARNAGINPTLLQQYIDGYKKPSELRIKEIETFLHRLGKELSDISLSKIKN